MEICRNKSFLEFLSAGLEPMLGEKSLPIQLTYNFVQNADNTWL